MVTRSSSSSLLSYGCLEVWKLSKRLNNVTTLSKMWYYLYIMYKLVVLKILYNITYSHKNLIIKCIHLCLLFELGPINLTKVKEVVYYLPPNCFWLSIHPIWVLFQSKPLYTTSFSILLSILSNFQIFDILFILIPKTLNLNFKSYF